MGARKRNRGKGKKRKRKSFLERERESSLGRLKHTVEQYRSLDGRPITWVTKPAEKMSKVIVDFAEPLLDQVEDDRAARITLGMAIVAWNAALLPDTEREEVMAPFLRNLEGEAGSLLAKEADQVFHMLLERKRALFADNARAILGYEIVEGGEGLRLNVASTLAERVERGLPDPDSDSARGRSS
jgi:hypothetical protein